jgi:hypothetical protein
LYFLLKLLDALLKVCIVLGDARLHDFDDLCCLLGLAIFDLFDLLLQLVYLAQECLIFLEEDMGLLFK